MGQHCSCETIANLAARMRCSPSLAGTLTVGMEDEMVSPIGSRVRRSTIPISTRNTPTSYQASSKVRRQVPGARRQVQDPRGPGEKFHRFIVIEFPSFEEGGRLPRIARVPSRPRRTARRTARANWRSSSSKASETRRSPAAHERGRVRGMWTGAKA